MSTSHRCSGCAGALIDMSTLLHSRRFICIECRQVVDIGSETPQEAATKPRRVAARIPWCARGSDSCLDMRCSCVNLVEYRYRNARSRRLSVVGSIYYAAIGWRRLRERS